MPSDSIVFVDTDVLLHADDGRRPDRHRQAREWLAALWLRRCGRLSTQVLSEYYANATGKLAPWITQGDARAEVRRYQHWKPWQIDHQTVETAWAVEARYKLSWWDSMIVAAAQHQSCSFLLTEALHHGQVIDKLQIINPFLVGPEILDNDPPTATVPTVQEPSR
jgi:predicted nucleic acid-binding protein